MIDHAPRIRAEQQQSADQDAINDLERRSAPLHWALIAAVLTVCLWQAGEQLVGHVERYLELAATEEAMVQCLNGRLIHAGGALVQCDVHEVTLVAQGEQP